MEEHCRISLNKSKNSRLWFRDIVVKVWFFSFYLKLHTFIGWNWLPNQTWGFEANQKMWLAEACNGAIRQRVQTFIQKKYTRQSLSPAVVADSKVSISISKLLRRSQMSPFKANDVSLSNLPYEAKINWRVCGGRIEALNASLPILSMSQETWTVIRLRKC